MRRARLPTQVSTAEPSADPARVADLERRLAHAMGEIARLRQEPDAAPDDRAYQPYVPGDERPEPAVTVDGAPVAAGDGRLADAVRREGAVVEVDGQVIPESAAALRALLGPDTFDELSRWLLPPPVEKDVFLPDPDKVERIAPGPRPVPLEMRLATTTLGPVELFVLVMTSVCPLALWILVPGAALVASVVGTVVLGTRCARLWRSRVPLLRCGEVATVTSVHETIGSSSYTNVPLRRARGWDARWQSYTGQGRRTDIAYTIDGVPGRLQVRGAPYDGGVVLADPRRPGSSLCVSQLWFSVKPGRDGQLPRGLPFTAWLGVVLTLGAVAAMAVVAVGSLALLVL